MGYLTTFELRWKPVGDYAVPQNPETTRLLDALSQIGDKTAADALAERSGLKLITLDEWVGEQIENNEDANYCLAPNGEADQSGKWYDYETWLRDLSSRMHGVLFCMGGEGEEGGDLWKCFALDGKIQKCKATIAFPEFDKDKLA